MQSQHYEVVERDQLDEVEKYSKRHRGEGEAAGTSAGAGSLSNAVGPDCAIG